MILVSRVADVLPPVNQRDDRGQVVSQAWRFDLTTQYAQFTPYRVECKTDPNLSVGDEVEVDFQPFGSVIFPRRVDLVTGGSRVTVYERGAE